MGAAARGGQRTRTAQTGTGLGLRGSLCVVRPRSWGRACTEMCAHPHFLGAQAFSRVHAHSLCMHACTCAHTHAFPVHTCSHTGFCTFPQPHVLSRLRHICRHRPEQGAAAVLQGPGQGVLSVGAPGALPARAGGALELWRPKPSARTAARTLVEHLCPSRPVLHPRHGTCLHGTEHSAPPHASCPPGLSATLASAPSPLAPGCWPWARGHRGGLGRRRRQAGSLPTWRPPGSRKRRAWI